MIELERHIEILLLCNDCVIVPHLGGFMAHHVEARYDEHDNMFLPPLRTLGFNPQLNINDSLLVQSYIEAYDISYPEALQRIEDEVEELKQHLQNEGSYELNDIGLLALNEDGNYVFTPCEAGILTPGLYGLNSVEMDRLEPRQQQTQPTVFAVAEETSNAQVVSFDSLTPETEEADIVRIKYTWVRNAVAVAAILVAVFILALPTGKTDMMQRTISNINSGILFGMTSKDTNTSKIDIKKADIAKEDTVTTAKTANAEMVDEMHNRFCIVLATHVSMHNATSFIERLQKQGFEQAKVFERNNIRRVIYGHYPTEEAAHDDLRRFHRNAETVEAWVMQL